MHAYELSLEDEALPVQNGLEPESGTSLSQRFLEANEEWFCGLRWVVVVILIGYWAAMDFSALPEFLGLRADAPWALVLAIILSLGNTAFVAHRKWTVRHGGHGGATPNLWAQISFDLLVLTAVVHYVGSLETYAPFAYVFHIALACIFFSPVRSFRVAALASVLYVVCVALERSEMLPASSIYADATLRQHLEDALPAMRLNMVSMVGVFGIVWYLVSHLSAVVRKREQELEETNRRLVQAQEERTRHMLRTTHQLKAPFAAIDANVQVLAKGHCGELSDAAVQVVDRISQRCRRLASEIQEMLQLANLRSPNEQPRQEAGIDLAGVIMWSIRQVQAIADGRGIEIERRVTCASTVAAPDHLKMLFSNLLSNAVNYSHEGGKVLVQCARGPEGQPVVIVEDHGIGIPADKLPHVFDEYYRAEEAVRHYKESTGLGLTIVRHVVRAQGIGIRVESELGAGTRFTLTFPKSTYDAAHSAPERK